MKISGVTIVKNAIEYDYPVIESIKSLLPLVDEMIVSIGDGTDATEEAIRNIDNDKIKIVHSVWDKTISRDGTILAVETDKALQHVSPDSDWVFYLQADEVLHEEDYETIKKAAELYSDDRRVEGLLFKYKHFYGSYNYVGDSRKWYLNEIRIIRNGIGIKSYRDAQGFRLNDKRLKVKKVNAFIYHYGWVRTPNAQVKKLNNFYSYWNGGDDNQLGAKEIYDYMENADSLEEYKGSHPEVMQHRILNWKWNISFNTNKKQFSKKDLLLYRIEKLTGKRLFDYRNYKII